MSVQVSVPNEEKVKERERIIIGETLLRYRASIEEYDSEVIWHYDMTKGIVVLTPRPNHAVNKYVCRFIIDGVELFISYGELPTKIQ